MQPGGQLTETTDVDNFPGYPTGIDGPQMMVDLRNQAARFDTDIRSGFVTAVNFSGDKHHVTVDNKKQLTADSIIISTGASAKWLGLESEQKFKENGGGVSACAVCDGFFYRNQDVAIVGGGDSAVEEATYLAKLCNKVSLIVRKDHLRASKAMQHRAFSTENLEILFNHETQEVLGDETVTGVRLLNNKTNETKELPVTGFFVAIGHKPNTDIFKDYLELDDTGYIINEPGSSKTNVPGVFVSGDAADKIYRQAVTAAGTGCMAALDAERYLAELN